MTTRLDYCKNVILDSNNEGKITNSLMQELLNLLPTYREKIALQKFAEEIDKRNQIA